MEDIEYLIKELNLAELLVNEIARFVDSHSEHDHYSTLRRLKARLELLQFILYNSPECLTPYLGQKLWTCLVGEKALGTSERDHGFEFYINYSTKSTGACSTHYLSLVDPALTINSKRIQSSTMFFGSTFLRLILLIFRPLSWLFALSP